MRELIELLKRPRKWQMDEKESTKERNKLIWSDSKKG